MHFNLVVLTQGPSPLDQTRIPHGDADVVLRRACTVSPTPPTPGQVQKAHAHLGAREVANLTSCAESGHLLSEVTLRKERQYWALNIISSSGYFFLDVYAKVSIMTPEGQELSPKGYCILTCTPVGSPFPASPACPAKRERVVYLLKSRPSQMICAWLRLSLLLVTLCSL